MVLSESKKGRKKKDELPEQVKKEVEEDLKINNRRQIESAKQEQRVKGGADQFGSGHKETKTRENKFATIRGYKYENEDLSSSHNRHSHNENEEPP